MISRRFELISYLISNGWNRDNRCRTHETYKKTVGSQVFRVQLRETVFFFDSWVPDEPRGKWVAIQHRYFDSLNSQDFTFLEMDEEDYDHHDYLERLGAL